jgi:hypothetical protein
LALQAGGVHIGANVSEGRVTRVGDSVTGTIGVGTNRVHARRMRSIGIAVNRFIVFAFLQIGTLVALWERNLSNHFILRLSFFTLDSRVG